MARWQSPLPWSPSWLLTLQSKVTASLLPSPQHQSFHFLPLLCPSRYCSSVCTASVLSDKLNCLALCLPAAAHCIALHKIKTCRVKLSSYPGSFLVSDWAVVALARGGSEDTCHHTLAVCYWCLVVSPISLCISGQQASSDVFKWTQSVLPGYVSLSRSDVFHCFIVGLCLAGGGFTPGLQGREN